MKIWQCDQWAASEADGKPFDKLDRSKLNKGDAGAINNIGIGHGQYAEVTKNDHCPIGEVWLKKDRKGNAEIYRYNYDSSG
jgi:hypothetical protein